MNLAEAFSFDLSHAVHQFDQYQTNPKPYP